MRISALRLYKIASGLLRQNELCIHPGYFETAIQVADAVQTAPLGRNRSLLLLRDTQVKRSEITPRHFLMQVQRLSEDIELVQHYFRTPAGGNSHKNLTWLEHGAWKKKTYRALGQEASRLDAVVEALSKRHLSW